MGDHHPSLETIFTSPLALYDKIKTSLMGDCYLLEKIWGIVTLAPLEGIVTSPLALYDRIRSSLMGDCYPLEGISGIVTPRWKGLSPLL